MSTLLPLLTRTPFDQKKGVTLSFLDTCHSLYTTAPGPCAKALSHLKTTLPRLEDRDGGWA